MLPGNDVFDVEGGQRRQRLGQAAVLTTEAGTLPDAVMQGGVHHEVLGWASNRRARACKSVMRLMACT
jgi:hypothetical protein